MSIEKDSASRLRRTKIREAILVTLQLGGLIALTALAPNTLSVLGRAITKKNINNARGAVGRLIQAGLVTIETKSGKRFIQLTERGKVFLATRMGSTPKSIKWDGRWRIVIFDIPESKRLLRQRLRDALFQIGYVKLQDSVWVHPFDSEEILVLLKADYRLGKEVLYIIADSIENDLRLRRHFGLKERTL
mgnify:FL=1